MAELKDQLRADMKAAMKAKDQDRLGTIRMALSAIGTAEVEGSAHELTYEEEQRIVTREVRQRKDSAASYAEGGRDDLVAKELAEAEVLQAYLPAPLGEDEVRAIVDDEITQLSQEQGEPPSMKQMGVLMKAVNARVAGRFDGAAIAGIVKDRLR